MKRKVLYVITKSNWGGAQRYVYNLAAAMPRDEFEVAVALGGTGRSGSGVGELATRLMAASIPTLYISSFARDVSLLSDIRATRELYRLFKQEKPDIVHLNSSKAGGVGALAARMAGITKIVFTSHGLVWDEDRGPLARFCIYLLSRFTFLLCHQVIVISNDNLARTSRFAYKKFVLIHNGLSELQFETRERARMSLALRLGLVEQESSPWIGAVAELTRNKGLSYLIDAAKLLIREGRTFHLCIIGQGEEAHALQKQIHEADIEASVHLAGFIPDAYRYNKAFDIFVLSSVKEGLPTVLLEAGQAGLAAVASNIPGSLDIIEDAKTGLLASAKNATDMANKIRLLIDDAPLRAKLGSALQEKVSKEFSLDRMVQKTIELYRA